MSGLFGKSFERELGKNTGKWVSNLIFGDGHSTPYRRVDNARQQRNQQVHELNLAKLKVENKARDKAQLLLIDGAVLKNVDIVSNINIPNNFDDTTNILSQLAVQIKTNKWQWNNAEGKIRNKYNEAILEKFNQGFVKLQSLEPESPQIEYFENILKRYKRNRFFKKHPISLSIALVIFLVFCVFLASEGIFLIVIIPTLILAITLFGFLYFKKKKSKVNTINRQENIVKEAKQENLNLTDTDSVFFDLNENGRIENTLKNIWSKYNGVINSNIISRKPIFSADGVKDSILFVGINPSYNASDDNTFIKSDDGNSLMYGSFYQRQDSPDYFKGLEFFADRLNKGYTQINLLYARENDRDSLLKTDHNFIREQLELTYDTILKIKPIAIFFFSDYCKDLIFGADRWVNPNSEINGSYILNGTNFPVFFTNDITTMPATEQIELIKRVQDVIKK